MALHAGSFLSCHELPYNYTAGGLSGLCCSMHFQHHDLALAGCFCDPALEVRDPILAAHARGSEGECLPQHRQ